GLAAITTTGPPALSQNGLSSGAAVQGRWMQADPNATGMVVEAFAGFHGAVPLPAVQGFDIESRLGVDPSLYQYLGDSPLGQCDLLGLSSDPFSMVDEYLAADAGSKTAFFEQISGTARAAAYLGMYAASLLPNPFINNAADFGM